MTFKEMKEVMAQVMETHKLVILEQEKFFKNIAKEREQRQIEREAEYKQREAEREQRAIEREQREIERKQREIERKQKKVEDAEKEKKADAKWQKEIKAMNKRFGEFTNSYGEEVEVLFYRSINKTRKIGEIQFHRIFRNVQATNHSNEYDMIMVNGEYVAIVEIKRTAKMEDLINLTEHQTKNFREEMREYKDLKLICILAAIRCEENVLIEAKKQGVCIVLKNGVHIKEEYEYIREF